MVHAFVGTLFSERVLSEMKCFSPRACYSSTFPVLAACFKARCTLMHEYLLLYITACKNDDPTSTGKRRFVLEDRKRSEKTLKTGHNIFSRSQFACGLGILVAPTFFPYSSE